MRLSSRWSAPARIRLSPLQQFLGYLVVQRTFPPQPLLQVVPCPYIVPRKDIEAPAAAKENIFRRPAANATQLLQSRAGCCIIKEICEGLVSALPWRQRFGDFAKGESTRLKPSACNKPLSTGPRRGAVGRAFPASLHSGSLPLGDRRCAADQVISLPIIVAISRVRSGWLERGRRSAPELAAFAIAAYGRRPSAAAASAR